MKVLVKDPWSGACFRDFNVLRSKRFNWQRKVEISLPLFATSDSRLDIYQTICGLNKFILVCKSERDHRTKILQSKLREDRSSED